MIFGSYGQEVHETNQTNMTIPRTLGVIYLQALDTLQGGLEVINRLTGEVTSCCKVTPIPINQEVINRVETIFNKYGIKYPLKFKDCKEGTICEDGDENDDADGSITGVNNEDE